MRGTTVPHKEQNKAFDKEIGQPLINAYYLLHHGYPRAPQSGHTVGTIITF